MILTNGTVFCEDGVFHAADVVIQGDSIDVVRSPGSGTAPGESALLDVQGCYVVPGFVDIHIHGAMGADFSDGTLEATQTMAQFLCSQGVTSFLGTSMALPEERLQTVYATSRPLMSQPVAGQATLWGINMEGPFFNVEKRGAQNEKYIINPDFAMFGRLYEASGEYIKTVAVAPETPGGMDFIAQASQLCAVSLAHSCADYDTACAAFAHGANHVTHLFNGMLPFGHRDPGIVGAACDNDVFAELICDGHHIHPSVIRAVFALLGDDRVCLISDAMRACGMPDGQYDLGGQEVTVANGTATIANGSLAGSITVLSDCVRQAVRFGVPLESALKAATINPARSVGIADKVGALAKGKRADLLVLEKSLALKHVILGGVLQS